MRKLKIEYVYLYELDSVNTSQEELKIAADRLYEELVYKGHRIVASMNQLADSLFFSSWLQFVRKSDGKHVLKDILIWLVDNNFITICCGTRGKSCVEYIIKNLDMSIVAYKTREKNGDYFFSSLPFLAKYPRSIRNTIYEHMREALIYSDINILDELKSDPKMPPQEVERIKNYIDFLLRINMCRVQYHSYQNDEGTQFSSYLTHYAPAFPFDHTETTAFFLRYGERIQKRSVMLHEMNSQKYSDETCQEIEVATNLLYNRAIENNIRIASDGKLLLHPVCNDIHSAYPNCRHNYIYQLVQKDPDEVMQSSNYLIFTDDEYDGENTACVQTWERAKRILELSEKDGNEDTPHKPRSDGNTASDSPTDKVNKETDDISDKTDIDKRFARCIFGNKNEPEHAWEIKIGSVWIRKTKYRIQSILLASLFSVIAGVLVSWFVNLLEYLSYCIMGNTIEVETIWTAIWYLKYYGILFLVISGLGILLNYFGETIIRRLINKCSVKFPPAIRRMATLDITDLLLDSRTKKDNHLLWKIARGNI